MPSLRHIVATAALAVLCAVPPLPIRAADGELLTLKASSVGFGGKFKSGFWQPMHLELAAGQGAARGRLEIVCADGDQTPVIYSHEQAPELILGAGQHATVHLYAKSGPIGAPLVVRLRREQQVVWQTSLSAPTLGATQELVVGIG